MYKKYKTFISLLLNFLILLSFVSYAQETESDFGDPGMTPDSPLYNLELFYEGMQLFLTVNPVTEAELASSFIEERHAEMEAMLAAENYDAMRVAVEEAHDDLEVLHEAVESISPTEENLEVIYDIEKQEIIHENHIEDINLELEQKVESGEISIETLESVELSRLEEATVEAQVLSEQKEVEVIEAIAVDQGITEIEAEIIVDQKAEDSGLLELQTKEVREEFLQAEQNIEELEAQIVQLESEGAVISDDNELAQIIDEAKTELQICEDKYEHGVIDDAFEELVVAEQLILNAELALESPAESHPELVETIEFIEENQDAREEEAADYISDYEEVKDELAEKYPEKADEFEYDAERAQKVYDLAQKLSEEFSRQFEALRGEGKSEEEVIHEIAERFAAEYRLAYGEEYLPPGVEMSEPELEVIPIGEIPEGQFRAIGGFVEGYEYTDPVSGFKYEFTDGGYRYTTPLGYTYEESFPEGYAPPEGYETGSEVHNFIEKTPEGSIIYNYYPTGYEVVQPDGETETFAYPQGEYDVHGGGKIEITPTGYEVTTESGAELNYDYNPKFENYVSVDTSSLNIFTPPEGASLHQEEIDYSRDNNVYSYEYKGEVWVYNPDASVWSSSTGETYKPEATSVAPVGYEDAGEYATSTGEIWTYDSSTGTWTSSTGETYNPGTHEYSSTSGETWSYDSSIGKWVSSSGQVHEESSVTPGTEASSAGAWSFNPDTNAWTDSSTGESWTYDSSTGTWTSSTGGTYTPPSGDSGGYHEGETSGGYGGGY